MATRSMRLLLLLPLVAACARLRQFPLREPMRRDNDDRAFSPEPELYYSPFAWDGANQMVFRPLSRVFAVDPAGPALNVNSLDEVPDSSWFTNRLGVRTMSPEEVTRGSCADRGLDPNGPDGSWLIDKGKDNGANPGFRITVDGLGRFMLKSDPPTEPERATGATAIASRVYHAIGYPAPCDSVVYLRPKLLKLKPGLTVTNNAGVTRPLDEEHLGVMLSGASRRNGRVRMVASAWLPGTPLGPFRYDGTREDDPNDVVPHEDRRELRGARLVAAWLNHFDSREQNTMDTFIRPNGKKDGPGYVRHYIIDMGDCFGSVWSNDGISRRLGHAHVVDFGYIAEDFVTLGTLERPWERARRTGGFFNYFSARDFDPELWRGEYPNPAFLRMTEADAAWMARILARFSDELVAAAVKVGKYDAAHEQYLTRTLILRRDAILRRYLRYLSPLVDARVEGDWLCALDLARYSGVIPNEGLSVRARMFRGLPPVPNTQLELHTSDVPRICVKLGHAAFSTSMDDADPNRYVIVDVDNGYAKGPMRMHLYDLGKSRGFQLVGIERPRNHEPPG